MAASSTTFSIGAPSVSKPRLVPVLTPSPALSSPAPGADFAYGHSGAEPRGCRPYHGERVNPLPNPERLILTAVIGAQLGPVFAQLAVPKADQAALTAYIIAGIPVVYHLASVYLPRVLARLFPPPTENPK